MLKNKPSEKKVNKMFSISGSAPKVGGVRSGPRPHPSSKFHGYISAASVCAILPTNQQIHMGENTTSLAEVTITTRRLKKKTLRRGQVSGSCVFIMRLVFLTAWKVASFPPQEQLQRYNKVFFVCFEQQRPELN